MTAATRRRIAGDRGRERQPASSIRVIDLDAEPTAPTPPTPHSPPDLGDEVDPPKSRRPRPAAPSAITVALALSLVAVLAACALAGLTTRRDRADVGAGSAALAAATKSAATILSYDYSQLDRDFSAALALTTGSFRTDYQATTQNAVAALATQTHAVVSATVKAGGVVSSTSSRATVLLFVDQTTTSNRLSTPQVDLNRVQLLMQKVHGRWLVSGLTAL